jgi:hypothetical protein
MFYLYRFISDFYSTQLRKELSGNGGTIVASILSEKRTFWYAKMLHAQGQTFAGWGK